MRILENERLYAEVDENGILRTLYDKSEEKKNLVDPDGKTGSASYTLKSDDITVLPAELCSPYRDRNSLTDPSIRVKSKYELTKEGLSITLSTDDDAVSSFGLLFDLEFLDKDHLDAADQLLPTSPYTSQDGRYMYCIMTRPCGRFLVACATSPADGWRIRYSPEQCGHYILGFEFLASFDRYYGGSGRRRISVVLDTANSIEEAYAKVGRIFNAPYVIPVTTGGFDGQAVIRLSKNTDRLLLIAPNGTKTNFSADQDTLSLALPDFGKYTVIPYTKEEAGIDCVLWNGVDYKTCLQKLSATVKEPYHGDRNLCEGGCSTWSQIREMLANGGNAYDAPVKADLAVITGETTPYVKRRTIAPRQEGYAPYHMFESNRIQEQFFGVSILLDAYRLYGDMRYLTHAVSAMDELVANWITEDGVVHRGETDYTTVTAPVIPVVDLALFLKDRDPVRSERYARVAVKMADHVLRRGFDFPTEGAKTDRKAQMEDGSISCTALTLLYVARHIENKPAYIAFAKEVLAFHDAFQSYSPDCRMLGSSFRWWETVWEGDADGPAICAGHAWTIWRSEALFHYGVLARDKKALIDSYNGFVTNFSKLDENGNSFACYLPDYLCGGGIDAIRTQMLTIPKEKQKKTYKISHGYPENTDRSLSRYAWIRAYDTWMKTAAVLDVYGEAVYIRCHPANGKIVFDDYIETLYTDFKKETVAERLCREISVIPL